MFFATGLSAVELKCLSRVSVQRRVADALQSTFVTLILRNVKEFVDAHVVEHEAKTKRVSQEALIANHYSL